MFLLFSLVLVPAAPPVTHSVAYLRADPDGVGTGWVLKGEKKWLLTCRHVLGDRKTVEVFFPVTEKNELLTDRSEYLARRDELKKSGHLVLGKVLRTSDALDLALVELPSLPAGVAGLSLAADPPAPGAPLWAVGNRGDQELLWNLSTGVARQSGPLRDGYFWQGKKLAVDAPGLAFQMPVEEGDSGGPVVNAKGEVVAVVSAVRRRVPTTAIGPDATAVRAFLELPQAKAAPATADPLARATVWVTPTATDRRTAGVVIDAKRRWVLTSNRGVGPLDRVGVAFPLVADGRVVGDREAYRDPVSLVLAKRWATGTVVARDPIRDFAVVELDSLPADVPEAKFATTEPAVGDAVTAVCHPVGLEFAFSTSTGTVRQHGPLKLGRDGGKVSVTVLQLPAQATAAGGPIANAAGEIVGILAAADAPAGIGYAVAVGDVRDFLAAVPGTKIGTASRFLFDEFGTLSKLFAHATANDDTALSLHPGCLPARMKRAEARSVKGELADAIADLDRITEIHPQHVPALRRRAELYLLKSDPKAAQPDVQRVLEFAPEDGPARLLSAQAFAAAGDEPKAAMEFANRVRLSRDAVPAVLAAVGSHADVLEKKGAGTAGDWLVLALNAVAKTMATDPFAAAVRRAVATPDAKTRTAALRKLCEAKQ